MLDNLDARDHLLCKLSHQGVIGGDVGFTLSGIDDQNLGTREARLNLFRGRKASASHTRNPR